MPVLPKINRKRSAKSKTNVAGSTGTKGGHSVIAKPGMNLSRSGKMSTAQVRKAAGSKKEKVAPYSYTPRKGDPAYNADGSKKKK